MLAAQTIMPDEKETRMARDGGEKLASLFAGANDAPLRLCAGNDMEMEMLLPRPVALLLLGVLEEMGKGGGVSVTLAPARREFSTQQAADFLMVSRPYLIEELLEKGKIPFRKVGNRRRIRSEDLFRYRAEEEQEIARRETVMRELMAETERLGLYK